MSYKNGKIYKLTGNGNTYIGSTIAPLDERLKDHKKHYKLYLKGKRPFLTSFKCMENNNVNNCKIKLLKNAKCNTYKQLLQKESEQIIKNKCINSNIPSKKIKEKFKKNSKKNI